MYYSVCVVPHKVNYVSNWQRDRNSNKICNWQIIINAAGSIAEAEAYSSQIRSKAGQYQRQVAKSIGFIAGTG